MYRSSIIVEKVHLLNRVAGDDKTYCSFFSTLSLGDDFRILKSCNVQCTVKFVKRGAVIRSPQKMHRPFKGAVHLGLFSSFRTLQQQRNVHILWGIYD